MPVKFRSVNTEGPTFSFSETLFSGLAPDGALYEPERMPQLERRAVSELLQLPFHDIGAEILSKFIEEIPRRALGRILESAWDFPIPLVHLEKNTYLLELFHGPTLAFKDIGARFMAHTLSYLLERENRDVNILVATSGDTGSAVAHGFFNVPHISVFILYPSGKISPLQEQQMATLGGNVVAFEVEGTFDDCQRLVKLALGDRELQEHFPVTTANSINLGRLLPQISYYGWGTAQLKKQLGGEFSEPVIVVPSGNFGNLTAAVYAKHMGIPIGKLVAATNVNDVATEFLSRGTFTPHPSIQTYSNAMDVGNPSNLARLQALYGSDLTRLQEEIVAFRIDEDETLKEMKNVYVRTGRVLDPHTAVGVAGAFHAAKMLRSTAPMIVAATAHPAKFGVVVEKAVGMQVALPAALQAALEKQKQSVKIAASYDALRKALMERKRV
jgi:threonine synthase